MTRRFIEEPFERNPVLQYAAVNYLIANDLNVPMRVLAVWSKKLEALGLCLKVSRIGLQVDCRPCPNMRCTLISGLLAMREPEPPN